MNELPNIIISKSKPVHFSDDTSIIIIKSSPKDYENNIIQISEKKSDWFTANLFTLNFNKTCNI
jgi:hypothetical protein